MIKNLLLSAVTSFDPNQRKQCEQILNNEFLLRPDQVSDQLFNLMCSMDRNDHILGYTFMKKIIQQSQRQKLIDFNARMQKVFSFWYERDLNRNTINQQFSLQKENIINLHAKFLSLHTSMRYREQFIDVVPYKICEICSKNDKNQLHFYLTFYGQVLKQLDKYRIGNINSKRAAMGSVMLLKVTTKLHPQNSLEASLWIDFSINFSRFNRWVPDRNFLISCLSDYQLTKSSLMSLLQFLSVNIRQTWSFQDFARMMASLNREMQVISQSIKQYQCKQIQTLLKCIKSLLYNFFTCGKSPSNPVQTDIVNQFQSYENFDIVSSFIMRVIDYFSQNNDQQVCGNLSQLIIQYATQVLRMYINYLQEQMVEGYAKQFIEKNKECENYEKILVLLSSMPRFILSLFEYQNVTYQLLSGNMTLHQSYEPVYVNYFTHVIEVNQYLEMETIQKIAQFFYGLIKNRQHIINLQSGQFIGNNLPQAVIKVVQRMSLALYGLSKLAKYKEFTDANLGYFQMMEEKIFTLLHIASNDFSLLIDCLNELIKQSNPEWNQFICSKCRQMLEDIYLHHLRQQKVEFYQLQIQLYRVINKTFSLTRMLQALEQTLTQTDPNEELIKSQFTGFSYLASNFKNKSAPVKQEMILLIENIMITLNQLIAEGKFIHIQSLITYLTDNITSNQLFQEIFKTLHETEQFIPEKTQQNNLFTKVSIENQEYAIVDYGPSKQLHLSCIKILLQLLLYEQNLQNIYNIISRLKSHFLLCVWQALEILYPGKILPNLIPLIVQERLQKIRTGHILQLFQSMGLEEQKKLQQNSTPSWYQLYRNILREDSVVIDIIHKKVNEYQ